MRLLILLLIFSSAANAVTLSSLLARDDQLIVADKLNGKIIIVNGTVSQAPALYGRTIADSTGDINSFPITPAGEFHIRKAYSTHLKTDVVAFLEGDTSLLAIHPVWLGSPKQNRLQRLATETGNDNRITNGCINVPRNFFYDIINKLKDRTRLVILPEHETLVIDFAAVTDLKRDEVLQ